MNNRADFPARQISYERENTCHRLKKELFRGFLFLLLIVQEAE